jgi:tRNA-dihydrouridine synthase B
MKKKYNLTPEQQYGFWDTLPKQAIYLAPMSGITNKAYRQVVKSFYADILFPEFVSTYALHYGSPKTEAMLAFDEGERPIVAQLFGAEPEYFYNATKIIVEKGFDGVDINFGCPAPKVAKNGGGCALLGDLGLSREIIEAVLDAADGRIPVSVKTRMQYKDTHVREFAKMISDLPLAALCVHGRTFEKPYVGAADLNPIKEVRDYVDFKVMASGHAHTPEAAKETLDFTGADGVALARGTFGKPWIGKQIKDYLETGSYTEPTWAEKIDTMLLHARLVNEMHTERPFVEIRKVLAWYIRDIPHAATYRGELVRVNSIEEIEAIVEKIRVQAA